MSAHIRSANDYLPYLQRYIADGRISVELDFRRLGRADSPVLIEAEKTMCVWAFFLGVPLLAWFVGCWGAGAWGAAVLAAYFFWARPLIRAKTRRLITEQVLTDYRKWTALWGFGGVTLASTSPSGDKETCVSPSGNWMRFVSPLVDESQSRSA